MRRIPWLILLLLWCLPGCRTEERVLTLATTTTTVDSGLMAAILPQFEEAFAARVDVVAVGSGEALALGAAGDVDVVLVHARPLEEAFLAAGYGRERLDVMVNEFVIAGPAADPAGIQEISDVLTALALIAVVEAPFISRGDGSGTHLREQTLWAAAGVIPEGDWYQEVGQGMGGTLTIAAEEEAYTLSDSATLAVRRQAGLDLDVLLKGDPRLLNPYSVIAVSAARHPHIDADLAEQFVAWITSPAGQQAINNFQLNGARLFQGTSVGK